MSQTLAGRTAELAAQSIEDVEEICDRADAMGLGLVAFMVPDVRRVIELAKAAMVLGRAAAKPDPEGLEILDQLAAADARLAATLDRRERACRLRWAIERAMLTSGFTHPTGIDGEERERFQQALAKAADAYAAAGAADVG
jgi:hypothetical protein